MPAKLSAAKKSPAAKASVPAARRRGGEETRAIIMKKATRLFARSGYDAVSTREIAEAAKISVPAIYLYFADKRELYLACCVAVFQRSTAHMMVATGGDTPPVEKVRKVVHALVRMLINDPHLLSLFQWELATSDTEGLAILEESAFRESVDRLGVLIGEASGKPVARIDVIAVFALAFGLVQYSKVGAALGLPSDGDAGDYLAGYVLQKILPQLA